MLMISDDEIRKSMTSCKATIAQGNIESDSLGSALLKLFVCLKRKRAHPKINDRTKSALDKYIVEVLKLLFLHYDC